MTDNLAWLAPTIAASGSLVASLVAAWIALRAAKNIEKVEIATNSMKDALVKVTRSDALQEGHAAGVADEAVRQEEQRARIK